MRVGIGYDVHPLKAGRKLILGGVSIPFSRGLDGWSDADVLTHTIINALLGAAALGDIGTHFPAGDTEYKDISSLVLLSRVKDKLAAADYKIVNVDAMVVAEKPKLAEYLSKMREALSQALGIEISRMSIKPSTSNQLGFAGRGEGIAAHAVALIEGGKNESI